MVKELGPPPTPKRCWVANVPSPRPNSTGYVVAFYTGGGEVGQAIAVEVARRHGGGRASYAETLLVYERSIAETQQHRHVAAGYIGGYQVGQAVLVEVARGNRAWV